MTQSLSQERKLCLKDTAGHGPVLCYFRTKASAATGEDQQSYRPNEQDEESVASTIRLQDEPCRDAEAVGSPTGLRYTHDPL